MDEITTLLKKALLENGMSVTEKQVQLFAHYLQLLQTWNKAFNLTSITAARDMVYLHIVDSLAVQPYLHGRRLLDVGTGAGLPGIPLAIMDPQQQWVLLDKNSKKTRFLTQAIAELGLTNVTAVHSRSEDFHSADCFDSILSRAFGTIRLFLQTTEHLLCPNGLFIAMKGHYPQEELADIPAGFQVKDVKRLDIKGATIVRHVITMQTY